MNSQTTPVQELTTENLIFYLHEHECLWKLDSKDYKNVLYKNKVYDSIARKHAVSAYTVKQRIKSLKDQFRREWRVRKIENKSRCAGKPKKLRRGFQYFEELRFLADTIEKQDEATESNFEESFSNTTDSTDSLDMNQKASDTQKSNYGTVVIKEEMPYLQMYDTEGGSALIPIGKHFIADDSLGVKKTNPLSPAAQTRMTNYHPIQPKPCTSLSQPNCSTALAAVTTALALATDYAASVVKNEECKIDYLSSTVKTSPTATLSPTTICSVSGLEPPSVNQSAIPLSKRKTDFVNDRLLELVENTNILAKKLTEEKVQHIEKKLDIHPFFVDVSNSFAALPEHLQDEAKIEIMTLMVKYKKIDREEKQGKPYILSWKEP